LTGSLRLTHHTEYTTRIGTGKTKHVGQATRIQQNYFQKKQNKHLQKIGNASS